MTPDKPWRATPDPIRAPSESIVCWECGGRRKTSRDHFGHAYCGEHRTYWNTQPPVVWVSWETPTAHPEVRT